MSAGTNFLTVVATGVPVKSSGTADLNVRAYPAGNNPGTTPPDGTQQSSQSQPAKMTATNGMTNVTHLKINAGSGFTLLTCPVREERSFHLSFRTLQHKGHPHPVLSRSTPARFSIGSFTENLPANRVRNATASGSVKIISNRFYFSTDLAGNASTTNFNVTLDYSGDTKGIECDLCR